ncbi:ubiquitin-like protein 4B [Choloepus didactylus]|uniref:ubiquitin-like protein 4B n=1 Tax=Choloepus didactylus TaxID=27675 RepID=UPI00189EA2CB|nr:ubiquitin-like protein 4B [Choloepus didactylus]
MFLTVKLLLGQRCSLKVSGKESVATLKKLVSKQLQVPEEQQHLLFRGQLLADDKCLSDYRIGPNASISVIMRPLEKTAPEEGPQAQLPPQRQTLWHQLGQILSKHFQPQDAQAVLQELRQEHKKQVQRLSLEDLEQLARKQLAEEKQDKPREREPVALASEAT